MSRHKQGVGSTAVTMKDFPSSIPPDHADFLRTLTHTLSADPRIVGIAIEGSYLTNSMDEFSDLDLVVVVDPRDLDSVMKDRHSLAASVGPLLAAFTGEHVGESPWTPNVLSLGFADIVKEAECQR